MSIFDQTREAMGGFDPFAPRPEYEYEEWGGLVPAPSLTELVEQLAEGGSLDITREWEMASAQLTLRYIAARDDTATMPKIDIEEENA